MLWILNVLTTKKQQIMTAVATKLKNKSVKFNSQSVLEACGRALSKWNDLVVAKGMPLQAHEDYELLTEFSSYAVDKLLTDSSNSHKPPSQDPNREKRPRTKRRLPLGKKRKPGGQPGHEGHCLKQVIDPDIVISVPFKDEDIQEGWTLSAEVERRQVFDITFNVTVTEYQAQVCYDQQGKRHVAKFPEGVNSYVQYGNSARSFCANLQAYQMVPYKRTALFLNDVFNLPISEGVLKNNLDRLYDVLEEKYVPWAKYQLLTSYVLYTDETPINVSGKTCQAIIVSNGDVNLVNAYPSKSIKSVEEMGILPIYTGIVMSDCHASTLHFTNCTHVLCGIHLLRDLNACIEKEGMHWAELFKNFLLDLKNTVEENGVLNNEEFDKELKHYSLLITKGYNEVEDKKELGMPVTKSFALLNRLVNKQKEYLLFAIDPKVPFDNMVSERGLRMLKIHLKVSGCYKSLDNADKNCVIKSYIDTCRNHGIDPYQAIFMAFEGNLPDFINLDGCDEDLLSLIKNYKSDNNNDDDKNSCNDTASNRSNEDQKNKTVCFGVKFDKNLSDFVKYSDCKASNSQSNNNQSSDNNTEYSNTKVQIENKNKAIPVNTCDANLQSVNNENDKECSNLTEKDSFGIKSIVNKVIEFGSSVISTTKTLAKTFRKFVLTFATP